MALRIAINGYGRIGRNILRAWHEHGSDFGQLQIVAINDLGDLATHAHLTRHDSTHGHFAGTVTTISEDVAGTRQDFLVVNGQRIRMLAEADPQQLPWRELDIDLVLECTGHYTSADKAAVHLAAGARRVLISAPAGANVKTVVYGINHHLLTASDRIVSNASCTTNCLAPLILPLHQALNIEQGLMVTIHSVTNDQVLTDVYQGDLRRARAATHSMIPTRTGAAAAIGLVIPELAGRLDGYAMRVPTLNVSLVDLTLTLTHETTVAEVNGLLRAAAAGPLAAVMKVCDEPLVSIDFNHDPASCTADLTLTQVIGRTVKVCAWYDNEWGFANRMLDVSAILAGFSAA